MRRPLVSVIIGTYNRVEFLGDAIASALAQTHENIEVIVSDDCGPEEVRKVADSFADTRIRYRRNTNNLGIGGNHHAALLEAKGDYFAFLNDDDIWTPEFLEKLLLPLERDRDLAVAFCDHFIIDVSGRVDSVATERNSRFWKRDQLERGVHRPFWTLALLDGTVPDAMATVFRATDVPLEHFKPQSGCYYSLYVSYLACRTGKGAFYHPERLTCYRVHNGMETANGALRLSAASVFCYALFMDDPALREVGQQLKRKYFRSCGEFGTKLVKAERFEEASKYLGFACVRSLRPKFFLAWVLAIGLKFAPDPLRGRVKQLW